MAKCVLKMAIRCLLFDRRFLGGKAGGYIMAIVRQHRLLADLGPEYVILVQTCHLSVEVSSIKSNFSQQTHTAL